MRSWRGSLKQTRYVLNILLEQLDGVEQSIEQIEKRMKEVLEATEEVKLLMTMPGVGFILAVVISQGI